VVVQHLEAVRGPEAILPMAILAISVVALALGVSATLLVAKLTARRLSETQGTAAAIAAGDLSRRIPMERLDGMFAVQARSLNQILNHMAELVRAQQLFSSNLAHDLRTPMMRLRSQLEKPRATIPRHSRRCATGRSANAVRSSPSSTRCCGWPRSKPGSIPPPWAHRAAPADPRHRRDDGAGHHRSRRIESLDEFAINGDPDLMNQLLVNLLENVATHTPVGTNVTISLESAASGATITVRDDGPGLAMGDFARVMQPFERGLAVSPRKGSGLGLAIASAIVRFHKGCLDLADAMPGLEVRVKIPAHAVPQAA